MPPPHQTISRQKCPKERKLLLQNHFRLDDWGNWRLNSGHPDFSMNKKIQSQYVAVLEALKAHGCISAYSIVGDAVNLAWGKNGVERVVQEFIARKPKPFGLKKSQRGVLMLVLPQCERERIDDIFISGIKELL
jgi:hypothetical protein